MSVDPFQEAQKVLGSKKKCPIPRVKATLKERGEDDKVASLEAALAAPKEDLFGSVIRTVLSDWGFNIGSEAVQRHRRGACGCE